MMAAWNVCKGVDGHRDNSGSTSRPPLPRPDGGDNVGPTPLWEIEFCLKDNDISWEKFCRNKWFIGLHKNVMDWDDSEAFKNFQDAKERYRAKHHGEPYEVPVFDPDMYIDEVDQPYCIQNTSYNNLHGGGPSMNLQQQGVYSVQSSGPARMLPSSGRLWIGGNSSGGARNCNVGGGGSGNGGGKNWKGGSSGGGNNGSGRNRNGGGDDGRNRNGSGGSGFNWNCFGRGNQRNQTEGQHGQRNSGGMQRNHNYGQHQMTSGGRQQQGQAFRKTKWYLVPPKDFPAA